MIAKLIPGSHTSYSISTQNDSKTFILTLHYVFMENNNLVNQSQYIYKLKHALEREQTFHTKHIHIAHAFNTSMV